MSHLRNTKQSGQTLMETIIAIFILTTALSTALGLAIYAFTHSQESQSQIIASNLAAEGVDVVRLMRDSNWLAQDSELASCGDIGGAQCYPNVFSSLSAGNQRLEFTPSTGTWSIAPSADYYLYLQNDSTYRHVVNGTSVFARMINLSFNSASPFTVSNPELIVKSVVAWRGKGCTDFTTDQNLLLLTTPCRVVVESHLTNWKDYK